MNEWDKYSKTLISFFEFSNYLLKCVRWRVIRTHDASCLRRVIFLRLLIRWLGHGWQLMLPGEENVWPCRDRL